MLDVDIVYHPCHYDNKVKVCIRFFIDMTKFDMVGYCNIYDDELKIENQSIDLSAMLDSLSTNMSYYKTYYFGGTTTKISIGTTYISITIQNNCGTDMSFESVIDKDIKEKTRNAIEKFNKQMNDLRRNPPIVTSGHM